MAFPRQAWVPCQALGPRLPNAGVATLHAMKAVGRTARGRPGVFASLAMLIAIVARSRLLRRRGRRYGFRRYRSFSDGRLSWRIRRSCREITTSGGADN